MLIDTHAHLYLEQFAEDLDAVIGTAQEAGVEAVLLPAIDARSIDDILRLCARFPGYCYGMAAIHPSYVKDASDSDLTVVADALSHPDIVAVGESGIDYYWDRSFDDRQREFLAIHAQLALDRQLPLVLHNRDRGKSDDSSRTLVEVLTEKQAASESTLQGVFHCFGPPGWLAEEVLRLGFHVGIGGTITHKNARVEDAIESIPLERIVLETDSPYLAPSPHRGERNEPSYVRIVAERLAEVRDLGTDEISAATTANARTLFAIGP